MTLNIELSPEREATLKAQAQARGLSLDQWVAQLLAESESPSGHPGSDRRPAWEIIVERMKQLPPEEFAKLPHDGADQLDHYLYGRPKRPG